VAGEHGSQGTEESCRLNETIIAYWYRMSMITCKWLGCWGIAGRLFGLALDLLKSLKFWHRNSCIVESCRAAKDSLLFISLQVHEEYLPSLDRFKFSNRARPGDFQVFVIIVRM
jgi:hypothetical protein